MNQARCCICHNIIDPKTNHRTAILRQATTYTYNLVAVYTISTYRTQLVTFYYPSEKQIALSPIGTYCIVHRLTSSVWLRNTSNRMPKKSSFDPFLTSLNLDPQALGYTGRIMSTPQRKEKHRACDECSKFSAMPLSMVLFTDRIRDSKACMF